MSCNVRLQKYSHQSRDTDTMTGQMEWPKHLPIINAGDALLLLRQMAATLAVDWAKPMVIPLCYPEFDCLHRLLCDRSGRTRRLEYWVPEFLVGGKSTNRVVDVGDPYRFFAGVLERIAGR